MELILTDIELGIETSTIDSFDVYFQKKQRIFVAVNPISKESHRYELTKSIEEILYDNSKEILEYCLSKVTKHDEVGIGDIFLHGKFIRKLE